MPNVFEVTVVEVGPRDGFQMEPALIPTELKIAIIDALADAGIRKIEATAFVSAKVIPQMKDAREVMQGIRRHPGVVYSALVPNLKGAQLATENGVGAVRAVICASETYNQRNVRMSIAESLKNCEEILGALQPKKDVSAEAVIGLCFGCPLEGNIPEDKVLALTGRLAVMGYREISIADSVGLANPLQVRRLMHRLTREFPLVRFSLHFHNTRGLGLANVVAGLEEGVDTFDSSLGGLGGCPIVPGGSGNIPTEDLVNLLEEMGVETGVDIQRVMEASRKIGDFLQRPMASYILQAGTRQQLYSRTAIPASRPQ